MVVLWGVYYWLSYLFLYNIIGFLGSSYYLLGTAYLFLIPAIIILLNWYVLVKKIKEKNVYIIFFSVFFPSIPTVIFLGFNIAFLFFGFNGMV